MQSMDYSSQVKSHDDDVIDIGQYIRILKRRKWSIILTTFIFIALAIFYIIKATPIYQASAKIQADPIQPNATSQDTYIMNSMVFLFYETQYEIIQSRKVAETVVDKLNLVERYKQELAEAKASGENESLVKDIKAFIKSLIPKEEESTNTGTQALTDAQLRTILAQGIQAGLSVEGGTQSQIINISYQHKDPVLAANIYFCNLQRWCWA